MMLALYVLLAWSVIGGLAAVVMGRAIAVTAGAERDEADLARALRPARAQQVVSLETRRVA
jgi:hypothetical protein